VIDRCRSGGIDRCRSGGLINAGMVGLIDAGLELRKGKIKQIESQFV
jgi:hypothetical protein